MANGKKTFYIEINGIQESVSAVDSLNKQLDALEKRIDALKSKNINISASGGVNGSAAKELKQEEALLKKIDQLHKKVADTEKKEYQELLHAKEELKEYQQIAKAMAAETNLAQGINDTNTMAGMKAQLRDIKMAMQVVDVDSDKFKQMQKQANDLNAKLLQIEKGYGQFGRNVGNYANGVAEGMQKVTISVGGVERTFNSAREASRTLNNELKSMALNGQQNTQEYKDLNDAVKQVNSTLQDTSKSSVMMDNLLDTMEGFTALGSIGVGFSRLFDIDDTKFNDTMQKFAALTLAMQGLEKLKLQVQKDEGMGKLFNAFSKSFDILSERMKGFTDKAKGWLNELMIKASDFSKELEKNGYEFQGRDQKGDYKWFNKEKGNAVIIDEGDLQKLKEARGSLKDMHLEALKGVRGFTALGKVMNGIGVAAKVAGTAIKTMFTFGVGVVVIEVLTKVMDTITDFVKSLNTTKLAADRAAESMKAFNRELEVRREILSASYLKGEINDEQFLTGIYNAQTKALKEQIDALQTRAKTLQNNASGFGRLWNMLDATQNTEYSGNRINPEGTTVGRGRAVSFLTSGNDLMITIKNTKELEKAWKECNEAIAEGKDYFDKWGTGLKGWWNSIWASVKDTEEVMRGLGNVSLSDVVARFGEINDKFNKGEISAERYAAELAKLKNEMNDSKVLNSVIANLDKYIPDEEVREAVQNIINEIVRLDDAFNMTSEGQIHYWNQVRIDAMKDGMKKEMAQIQENERHEVVEYGKTQEQINLIHAKYQRQRQNAQDRANKESANKAKEYSKKLRDAENELIAIRIENMKDGLEKELAQIENERRLALQKAKEYGKLSGEMQVEINRKYDKKILDEKRKWAFEVVKIYEDLEARIEQVNRATFEKEVETAERNVSMKESGNIRNTGYEMIQPSNYDDTKNLETYYKKVYDIQKKYLDMQTQIRQESIDRELDFNKKEEEIRHKRIVDENNGEYIQQLRAGRITQEQYNELIEKENAAHLARMNALEKEYTSQSKDITEENLKETQELYAQYFDKILAGISSDRTKIDDIISKPLIVDEAGWNIVNISKNRENFKKALADYESLKNGIIEKQKELKEALKAKTISADEFAVDMKSLDEEMKGIEEAEKNVKKSSKELLGNFFQSIQQYVQAVGQAATSIIQSIGEINDAAFEKEIEALDKRTEYYEKQLEKQKELTEKYANDVESIEDELETARGDRRQHLIDQLNAQMQAQRESLAQEKRIEKEQEKIAKKREQLEYENEMRKWNQSKLTAAINAALAISAAAVNSYPIPAIPMMALATAVGVAQMAAVAAAKPKKYADGGLLEGRSHRQGGIPVGNTGIEVEGHEFVTNKRTTSQNLELLQFINKKKRKIDLSDMIDFYSSKTKKNITGVKNMFADGGQLPTLRNDISINNRFIDTMEKYSERAVQVEVVDIINKADNVRKVQTLAGIS